MNAPLQTERLLVLINPNAGLAARVALLKWPKARGVPSPPAWLPARHLLASGMACEIDATDHAEAETFGTVTIIARKGGAP